MKSKTPKTDAKLKAIQEEDKKIYKARLQKIKETILTFSKISGRNGSVASYEHKLSLLIKLLPADIQKLWKDHYKQKYLTQRKEFKQSEKLLLQRLKAWIPTLKKEVNAVAYHVMDAAMPRILHANMENLEWLHKQLQDTFRRFLNGVKLKGCKTTECSPQWVGYTYLSGDKLSIDSIMNMSEESFSHTTKILSEVKTKLQELTYNS